MDILTSTTGQRDLPRYFARVFEVAGRLGRGELDFTLRDGRRFRASGAGPGPRAEIQVISPDLFARLLREGELGFCEAYLDGDWDTPDLQALMDLIQLPENDPVNDGFPAMGLVRGLERLRFWLQSNSHRQARRNIAAHYDLGNEFYRLWLDDSMTYSSALFASGQESLERAQEAKYASVIDRMGAKTGDHVLEIGCGWGGFAERALQKGDYGIKGLTISAAQHDFALRRVGAAADIALEDYRNQKGLYDQIVSIEMFEAVGEDFWPVYFSKLKSLLAQKGKAVVQTITIADALFDRYRKSGDAIRTFIFPGGMLPSPARFREESEKAGLRVTDAFFFGQDYALTLKHWLANFDARRAEVLALGFDEKFIRMWRFYLTCCIAAFRHGRTDVAQWELQHAA